MKNLFLSAAIALSAIVSPAVATAQFNFSKSTAAYTPLTGATSITKGKVWHSDTSYQIPLGFSFKLAGTPVTSIYLSGNSSISASLSAVQSGFVLVGGGLVDRGTISGVSKSDIRYSTTGTTGSRIFKLEIFNGGFEDELEQNGEQKDSLSLQVWLYEGSNVTEVRYGPGVATYFEDYFGPRMMTGYLKNFDTAALSFEKFYVVDGSPANPVLDSMAGTFSGKGLTSLPTSGTVFRFAPKGGSTTGIEKAAAGTLARVYPTICSGELSIARTEGGSLDYSITSLNGQMLAQGKTSGSKTTLDISGFSPGSYLVRLASGSTYEVQQIVKR